MEIEEEDLNVALKEERPLDVGGMNIRGVDIKRVDIKRPDLKKL